jgi:PKHD-type hydroxylase
MTWRAKTTAGTEMMITLPALSPDECDAVIAAGAAGQMRRAGLVGSVQAGSVRRADIIWVDDLPDLGWVMDRMVGVVSQANREAFGFAVEGFDESAQLARYDAAEAAHFDWHSDVGAGVAAARRKLTVVVQLSAPDYEGGALELRPSHAVLTADRARGMACVFPSYVLHRVAPVTAGLRWSLTLWAHGPAFR